MTANHYFLDAVGGFVIFGIGYVVARLITRAGRPRPRRELATRRVSGPDLDHVAIATTDIAAALATLVGDLGGTVFHGGERLRVPLGPDARRLRDRGHDDRDRSWSGDPRTTTSSRGSSTVTAAARTTSRSRCRTSPRCSSGAAPPGSPRSASASTTPHWREAFLQPRDAHGTVVQLAQTSEPHAIARRCSHTPGRTVRSARRRGGRRRRACGRRHRAPARRASGARTAPPRSRSSATCSAARVDGRGRRRVRADLARRRPHPRRGRRPAGRAPLRRHRTARRGPSDLAGAPGRRRLIRSRAASSRRSRGPRRVTARSASDKRRVLERRQTQLARRQVGDRERAEPVEHRRDRGLGQHRDPGAGRHEVGDEPDALDLDRDVELHPAARGRRLDLDAQRVHLGWEHEPVARRGRSPRTARPRCRFPPARAPPSARRRGARTRSAGPRPAR